MIESIPGLHSFPQGSMDCIGFLEKRRSRNRYIVLIGDHNTQCALAVALPDSTAEMIGVVLVKGLFYRFGVPEILASDKASYWITAMLKTAYEFWTLHGIVDLWTKLIQS